MKGIGLVRRAAISLATLGLLLPLPPVMAQSGQPDARVTVKTSANLAADIKLLDGAFTGRVVDHQGNPQKNHEVIVRQGDKELARVRTQDNGVFAVPGLKPGVYTASTGKTDGRFRVWNEQVAPPVAKGHALLVLGQNGERGQFGAVDPTLVLLTAGVIAAVIIAAITLSKVNDVQDCCESIPKTP